MVFALYLVKDSTYNKNWRKFQNKIIFCLITVVKNGRKGEKNVFLIKNVEKCVIAWNYTDFLINWLWFFYYWICLYSLIQSFWKVVIY